jgi:hypothetical protein
MGAGTILCKFKVLNLTLMSALILSGAGGSTNWLPLILPLVVIATILQGSESLGRYLKKRRLLKENKLVSELTAGRQDDLANLN